MKYLLLIIISTLTLNSCAQEKSIDLVDSVLNSLKIEKSNCFVDLIIEQSISEIESIIVIPEIAEKGEGFLTLNGHILIVNNKNGEIKSRFSEKASWLSDALRIDNIFVIYQPYTISKDVESIGIMINYSNNSRVNPYSSKELSLFIRNGMKLERVIKDYYIEKFNGESDGMNSGTYVEHKKTIEAIINSEAKFYDLKVTDSIIKTELVNGTEKIIEKLKKTEKLKYENGNYKNVL